LRRRRAAITRAPTERGLYDTNGAKMPWLTRPEPSSKRRAIVFLLAFLPAAIASLVWVYSQPPEYRAVARLQIVPAATVAPATDMRDAPAVITEAQSFLTEVQVVTSRPLLQDVVGQLKSSSDLPDLGLDPVAAAQRMLRAEPIEGSQIVRLSAIGPEPQFVAHLVNTVADTYRRHVADAYNSSAKIVSSEVADEVKQLESKVAAQRDAVNEFRKRYDIVSIEHRENDVLANIDGLSKSYTEARQKLATAQGHLDALRSGKAVLHAKDDPTLAALQKRASELRGQWSEVQRRFTPAYLALDPDAKSLRAQLDDIEEQLKSQTGAGEYAALREAQQDVFSAQVAVDQLRQSVADNQKQAQEFATHLNDYKAMREDLDHLEGLARAALDRLAKLQASERERAPQVAVLEAAAPSSQPWRPDYPLEAALAVGGSVVFGLFATWFVDFLAGNRPQAPLFVPYSWAPAQLSSEVALPLLPHAEVARLPPPAPPPRELTDEEITAFLGAATADARLAAVALLSGLGVDEIAALRWTDVEFGVDVFRAGINPARVLPLNEPLRSLLAARHPRVENTTDTVLQRPGGGTPTGDEVARLILFAAYDAGLDHPQEVTPEALRYTYLSFLLRQGIRAADIDRIVGPIPQAELVAYMHLHSPARRRPIEEIERLLPSLKEIATAGIA
jgi:polysaccharide biosynthesis transport protein